MEKFFIDSSLLIEFQKNNKEAVLLFEKWNKPNNLFFINAIVVSEVAYILTKKLKLRINDIAIILQDFNILSINGKVIEIMYDYMHKYNLKPNDAIIAATCKYHNIPNILTIDSDFTNVCKKEGIKLIAQ